MRRVLLTALFLALLAIPASSYQYLTFAGQPVRWRKLPVTVYTDAAGVPSSVGAAFTSEIQAALHAWNGVPGSSFAFTYGGATPAASPTFGNGYSECYFQSLPSYILGITIVTNTLAGMPESETIVERDVQFNSTSSWTTSAVNTAGGPADFRTVAIHELGHVLGLMHETSKPSIMDPGPDPAFAVHRIYPDDQDGVRFLYPAAGPGPTGADLALDGVFFSPPGAGSGDEVSVTYTARNTGTTGSGGFRAGIYLTGSLEPVPTDHRLALVEEGDLPAGGSRTTTRSVTIPGGLPPGRYRIGVLLDPGHAVSETDETNNGGASAEALCLDRPPLELAPGRGAAGELGPLGLDTFTFLLKKGTRLKFRARLDTGTFIARILAPETGDPILTTRLARSVKGKLTAPEDGTYTLALESRFAGTSAYVLTTRSRGMKTRGRTRVEGETRIPVWWYAGWAITATVKGRGGVRPAADLDGLSAPHKANRSGTRVKLGPATVSATGFFDLLLGPGDGPPGEVAYKVKVKPPKKGKMIAR